MPSSALLEISSCAAPELVWLLERLHTPPKVVMAAGNPTKGSIGAPTASGGGGGASGGSRGDNRDDDPYLRQVREMPEMSREDEVAVGQEIEAAHRRALQAVLRTKLALRELPELEAKLASRSTRDLPHQTVERVVERLATLMHSIERAPPDVRAERVRAAEEESGVTAAELEEICAIVHRSEAQAAAARARLVEAHLRLVVWNARRHTPGGLPVEDLIQEGNLGLLTAACRFDYRVGVRFATYANWWIRQSMQRAIAAHGRTVSLPVHRRGELFRLYRAQRELQQSMNRDPSQEELAQALGISVERVDQLMRWARRIVSLQQPVGEEEDAYLGDLLADPNVTLPSAAVFSGELAQETRDEMSILSPREQEVLAMRFGIDRDAEMTLEEIGDHLGITRERVRQIEARALSKLRHPGRSRSLERLLESDASQAP